ncbi:MAG: RNase adapter RapZ [Thermodesulfovibrionales bacterium]
MVTARKKPLPARRVSGRQAGLRILVITGLSGSGKTVALRAVEDAGFFSVDNIPLSLISTLVESITQRSGIRQVAIGIDVREKEFLGGLGRILRSLRLRHSVDVLFLDARTDVLIRRFKETRRPHPLGGSIEDAIREERRILGRLHKGATRVIDTSPLTPHQLRSLVGSLYGGKTGKEIAVSLVSFGFKYGVPQNIDLLFDVRFLPNPFFIPALRDLDGRDRRVSGYVLRNSDTRAFLSKVRGLLSFLIPRYVQEGKSYLSIAFGCTGGKHRSPAIVEEIGRTLRKSNIELNIVHRDIS